MGNALCTGASQTSANELTVSKNEVFQKDAQSSPVETAVEVASTTASSPDSSPTATSGDQATAKAALETVPAAATAAVVSKDEEPAKAEGFQAQKYREVILSAGLPNDEVPGKMRRRPSSENITLDEYAAKHKDRFEKLKALEPSEGWTFHREEEEVRIYSKKVEGHDLVFFKGETTVKCDKGITRIIQVLLSTEDRPKWDEMCVVGQTPQYFAPFYKYSYVQMKSPVSIVTGRDMVNIGRFRFEEDGGMLFCMEYDDTTEGMPSNPNCVRAKFLEGGYILRPVNGSSTEFKLIWTGCVDPQGWLPRFVANLIAPKQGLTLAKVKKYI